MLTVDQLLAFRSVGEARISPDGREVVYQVGAALAGADAEAGTHLWRVATAGGAAHQLTYGEGKDTDATWSPDGQTIAFLSDRAGTGKCLYLLTRGGGEAQPLATGDGAIKGFAWSPDGTTIALLRADPEPETTKGVTNAPVVVEEAFRHDRLWTIALADGVVRRTTDAAAHIGEFAWFADGAALAVVVADDPTEAAWYGCRLARLDLATGTFTTLYQPPTGRQVARPAPAPDGRTVACVACSWSDSGMSGGDLWLIPGDPHGGDAPRNLTAGADFSINMVTWQPDGRTLLAYAYDDLGSSLGLIAADRAGSWQRLWQGSYRLGFGGIYPADDGRTFATQRSTGREPDDLWLGTIADGTIAWRTLTDTHGERRAALTTEYTELRWTAPDGLEIHGLLMRPLGMTGPVPLVTLVHGGPTGVSSHSFSNRGLNALAPLLAARGIATFQPNYRGSNGRGVAFAEANHGDMGGNDWTDIVAGIDRLVADGIADPGRLGLGGWSYGGYMTMWGVTQTGRFRAAVAGAGIANWHSFHGASDLHPWDALFYEADPYDPQGIYAARSPIYASHRVVTPTLVLHGLEDRVVPPDQGREFFRALKDRGVETRLVLYPGSGHGPHEPHQVRDVIERSLDWLTTRLHD